MMGYINAIKRGFRDQHGFVPTGGDEHEPLFEGIPAGVYLMELDGRQDAIMVTSLGGMSCCNFDVIKTRDEYFDRRIARNRKRDDTNWEGMTDRDFRVQEGYLELYERQHPEVKDMELPLR
jgi:hypothetical protein